MAKKKPNLTPDVIVSAPIVEQPITETIETNFMPYAMSVIVSRAIPDIDGFKPSHRKLLYTMYKMGLLNGRYTKSANVVGETMKLNPHGDQTIYETLVRLTRGNEALLHPFIDSKGSFGKHYSNDDFAAPRYTECRLDRICAEIFGGIDRDAVDFCDNYDNSMKEPVLLPTAFPNILVSPNIGVAVGMACSICSFNLGEICDGTIQLLKNPETDTEKLIDIIKAPDFPGGGSVIYDRDRYREIFTTGRGTLRVRSRYSYDKEQNCIDVLQIPYSTTIDAIIKKVALLIKEGKLKEITDIRDEIDVNGFRLTIDLRRGTDPEKLMSKLFRMTPLEDSFDCNFNILVNGLPQTLGVREILLEWIRFRVQSVKRVLSFDLNRKKEKLHLLLGLGKILLDIDKAIRIIRETQLEKDVVPNLMQGFGIDQVQAEYIADIRLRNLNREYILTRVKEIESLQKEIAELSETIGSETKLKALIASELKGIRQKYGKPRMTQIISASDIVEFREEDMVENYNVKLIFTKEGYFKKITLLSLRGNDEQKLKEGDCVILAADADNTTELLFFSDRGQVYKARVSDFDATKASQLGDYIPARLGFDEDERAVAVLPLTDAARAGQIVIFFRNGKGVRFSLSCYETKTNRRRLTGAFYDGVKPAGITFVTEGEEKEVLLLDSNRKGMILSTGLVPEKSTRTSQGVTLMNMKGNGEIVYFSEDPAEVQELRKKCRKTKLPAAGTTLTPEDIGKLKDFPEN